MGLQPNDRKILYALITFHGGCIERNFTSKTTHLICGSATGTIYTKAIEMKSEKLCIITPDWFYECLKVQELIDPKPYHPRLLKLGSSNSTRGNYNLSELLGTNSEKKTVLAKKIENVKPLSETVAKQTAQSIVKNTIITTTTTNVANSSFTANTSIPSSISVDDTKPKSSESVQTKIVDNSWSLHKNTLNQTLPLQLIPTEQSMYKENVVCL